MYLNSIELHRFRNILQGKLCFSDRITLVVGRNGQGKTSLLEAVFFLAHAKSFRTSVLKELSTWDSDTSATSVKGIVSSNSGEKNLCCKLISGSREVYLNDSRIQKASSFYGQLACIEFTPDHLEILKGQPRLRRIFLDRILAMCDSTYVDNLVAYQRALKNRNAVLRNSQQQIDYRELLPWDELLAVHGRIVVSKRLDLAVALKESFRRNYEFFLRDSSQGLSRAIESVDYELKSNLVNDSDLLSPAELAANYETSFSTDRRRKSTSIGPHRDDLLFYLSGKHGCYSARKLASQGQIRSIALALTLSAAEYLEKSLSESPIILLDDVISELDKYRRAALFELLQGLSKQIIITATEADSNLLADLGNPAVVEMAEGQMTPRKSA